MVINFTRKNIENGSILLHLTSRLAKKYDFWFNYNTFFQGNKTFCLVVILSFNETKTFCSVLILSFKEIKLSV